MKQLIACGMIIVTMSACTSPASKSTAAYDGNYEKPVITSKSPGCPDLGSLSYVTISNGRALFQGPNLSQFQGYVTPEGILAMSSPTGQKFQGQIDSRFVLRANVAGPNCAYDIAWTRAS